MVEILNQKVLDQASGDISKGLLDLWNSEFSNTLNGSDRIKNESESHRESFLEG